MKKIGTDAPIFFNLDRATRHTRNVESLQHNKQNRNWDRNNHCPAAKLMNNELAVSLVIIEYNPIATV